MNLLVQVYAGRVLSSGQLRASGVMSGTTLVLINTRPLPRCPQLPNSPVKSVPVNIFHLISSCNSSWRRQFYPCDMPSGTGIQLKVPS